MSKTLYFANFMTHLEARATIMYVFSTNAEVGSESGVQNEGLNAERDEKSCGGGNTLTLSLAEVNTPSVGSSNPGLMSGIVRRIKKGNLKAANKVRAIGPAPHPNPKDNSPNTF
jgi:hypothetical protein